MADDFVTGTRSAACGGTTTVIPFAAQFKGQSLRAAVDDYHRRAAGQAAVDYAFHLIVSDPTPQVLNDELPAAGGRGLHLVQALHDLRRHEARTTGRSSTCWRWRGAKAR
jgi:dihydroorotase-like cyclic amidohydrolase